MLQKMGLIDFSNGIRLTQLGVIAAQLAVDQQDKVQIHELGSKKIHGGEENGRKR